MDETAWVADAEKSSAQKQAAFTARTGSLGSSPARTESHLRLRLRLQRDDLDFFRLQRRFGRHLLLQRVLPRPLRLLRGVFRFLFLQRLRLGRFLDRRVLLRVRGVLLRDAFVSLAPLRSLLGGEFLVSRASLLLIRGWRSLPIRSDVGAEFGRASDGVERRRSRCVGIETEGRAGAEKRRTAKVLEERRAPRGRGRTGTSVNANAPDLASLASFFCFIVASASASR